MIICNEISFQYENQTTLALHIPEIIFDVCTYGIIGQNGAGKSTLFGLLSTLKSPQSGFIDFWEERVTKNTKEKALRTVREKIGYVMQHAEQQLSQPTVFEELCFTQKRARNEAESNYRNRMSKIAIQKLEQVGLDESFLSKNPFQLSGGEQRKVIIASILMDEPKLLLLDEPTIGLDGASKKHLSHLILSLQTKIPVIIISHDYEFLFTVCNEMIYMDKGTIIAQGDKESVLQAMETNGIPIESLPALYQVKQYVQKHSLDETILSQLKTWSRDTYGVDL